MAAITDLSALINRITGGNSGTPEHRTTWIDSRIGAAAATGAYASRWTSWWRRNKTMGGSAAIPGAAAAPTNSTTGNLFWQTDASGGREKWLLGVEGLCTQVVTVLLYDRLLHCGGLSGTEITAQTVGGTLTRNTGGADNQIWVEIYTLIGATGQTITASYTNQAGTSGRTTQAVAIGGTGLREAERAIPLPLQDGDTGVQSVQSVTLSGSTGTAGDFGVTVARPILLVTVPNSNTAFYRDLLSGVPAITEIDAGACLGLLAQNSTSSEAQLLIRATFVEA